MPALMTNPGHHSRTRTKLEHARLLKIASKTILATKRTLCLSYFCIEYVQETMTSYWNYHTVKLSIENVPPSSWEAKFLLSRH